MTATMVQSGSVACADASQARHAILMAVVIGLSLGISLAGTPAHAEPSLPWMPTASLRHDLEFLADEGGLDIPLMQWPLPRAAIRNAIGRLPTQLPPALAMARDHVLSAIADEAMARGSLTLRGNANVLTGFGDDATRGSSISLRSATFDSTLLSGRVGIRIESASGLSEDRKLRMDESALASEWFGVQLQAFSHRAWWGPGWQSSLVLGNNAPAFNGVGVQRASVVASESPWLAWLGPWNFDMFVAQTEDVSVPANPFIFGQRLSFKPFSHLEIGLTRTAQWGGRGRNQSVKSFFKMVTGSGVNADTQGQQAADPANEMAGYDLRAQCPEGLRCSVYVQAIGEDQAGLFPSHFLGLYGVESWSSDGRERFFAEYAETGCRSPIGRPFLRNCAYRNYAYPEGYANAGRWMGASVGPDSRLLTLGWLNTENATSIRLSVGSVGSRVALFSPQDQDASASGRLLGVSARTSFQLGAAVVSPELDWDRISTPSGLRNEARIGATLDMNLGTAFDTASTALGKSLASNSSPAWRPALVAAGLIGVSAVFDKSVDTYARGHAQSAAGKTLAHIGSTVPIAAFGLAGVSWAFQRGSSEGDLALSALVAGISAAGIGEVSKLAIDRSRPSDERGASDFGNGKRGQSSFPSIHTAVAWAVLTPYAEHYQAPWLYGVAALTNAGRIAGRDHWLSDTVAGAALGYYIGDLLGGRGGAEASAAGTQIWFGGRDIHLQTTF